MLQTETTFAEYLSVALGQIAQLSLRFSLGLSRSLAEKKDGKIKG